MNQIQSMRHQKDNFFETSPHSPLTEKQKSSFEGLSYFPITPGLDLTLELEPYEKTETVQIQTNTGEVQTYDRFGKISFLVGEESAELTIFRNAHGYFLPFADSLAGKITYGAGRYLEPEELEDGRLRVDFNQAYNPYCAYNANWSCPITPAENRLKVPIEAGEKNPEGLEVQY
jgi:uncharacterized protein